MTGVVGIVGLGLMGGSLAMAIREARPGLTVIGSDADPRSCRVAMDRRLVDLAGTDLDAVGGADVIFVAVPPLAMRDLLPRLAGTRAVVTDMCSTKAAVMEWAAAAGIDLVGGHPWCGRERSGIEAADPHLFRGAPWVLTRLEPAVVEIVELVGARPLVLDPTTHDRLAAGVSHAAFVVAAAYMLAAARDPEWPQMGELAAGGFRDITRLAGGDPEMEAGIASTNQQNLLAALDRFQATLAMLRRHVEGGEARLSEVLEEARSARRRWEESRAGDRP